MRLLYIDDDPDDGEIFCDAIREIDPAITCIVISNVESALYELDKGCPDYFFLDYTMPKVDGKEVLNRLKGHHCFKTTKVIMYSAFMAETEIQECMKMGAYKCMQKSQLFRTMCAELRGLLKNNAV